MPNLPLADQTALSLIADSKVLTPEDLKVVDELKGELKESFLTHQVFRTRTEMEVSVLKDIKFPTPDAKYWQAVREQNVMFTELVNQSFEYKKKSIELRKKQAEAEKTEGLDKELLDVEIEQDKWTLANMERVAKDRIRELNEWHDIKTRLLPDLKHGVEDCGKHQLASLTQRFIGEAMAAGNSGSPSERRNLYGLLDMSLKKSAEAGILPKVLVSVSRDARRFLESKGIDVKLICSNTSN